MLEGRAQEQLTPYNAKRKVYLGEYTNPVWMGTRQELHELITDDFYGYLEIWRTKRSGMGLPFPGSWGEQPYNIPLVMKYFDGAFNSWESLSMKKQ